MRYQRLGLGSIILAALGVTNDDTRQNERLDALETNFTNLNDRFQALTGRVAAGEVLDADEAAELQAIGEDLQGIASALNRAAPVVSPDENVDQDEIDTALEPVDAELPADNSGSGDDSAADSGQGEHVDPPVQGESDANADFGGEGSGDSEAGPDMAGDRVEEEDRGGDSGFSER